MGKIRSFLGIFALFVAVLSSGTARAATGYVCESYRKYTVCAENYYMATSANDLSYNNTPAVGNVCAPCPETAAYCPGGLESPVYKLTLNQRLATTQATITQIYFQENNANNAKGFCTDAQNCTNTTITQLTGNQLPQRTGYIFNGYSNDENDGDGDQYISEIGLIDDSGDVTAEYLQQYPVWYAHWKGVTVNCDAGTYWNATNARCETCPGTQNITESDGNFEAGYYCPGVSSKINTGSDLGKTLCRSVTVYDTDNNTDYTVAYFKSAQGASKPTECYIDIESGQYYYHADYTMETCPVGSYCPGGRQYFAGEDKEATGITACPVGTSDAASDSEHDCYFDVTLNPNNGTGTCATTQRCYYDIECTLPTWNSDTCNLSNDVKIFKGWAQSNTATSGATSMTFKGATSVYAVWVAPTCNVTNGIGTPQSASGNAPVCKVDCADGYNASGTYTGTVGNSEYQYTCELGAYSITYYTNGGQNATTNPNSYDVTTATIELEDPTRANSTFAGWYEEASFVTKVTEIANGSTGNRTFYAKWICNAGYTANSGNTACVANTITLSWNNGGHGTAPTNPASCTYGSTFTAPDAMTATGYTFGKWSVNSKSFSAGATINCTSDDLGVTSGTATITGTWTANTYNCSAGTYLKAGATTCTECQAGNACAGGTYTFNADKNQGIVACEDRTYATAGATTCATCPDSCYGSCIKTTGKCATCKAGYGYINGVCEPCTGNTYSVNGTTFSCSSCNAGYTANSGHTACDANTITLSWNNGGRGTAPTSPASCTYGSTFTAPDAMTATGYTFGKWSVNSKSFSAGATINCTSDDLGVTSGTATITGTWNAHQYTVTYNSNKPAAATGTVSGSMSDSQHVYDTEKALNNNTYALPGYVFAGWNTMENGTGTAYTNAQNVKNLTANNGANVPLYAQWTPCATGTYCPGDNTVQTCPTDTLGRTVVSSVASDEETDCYVTCGAKTIENGTTTLNATQINFNGTSYPECTYSVSCNSGFGAAGNNTATPTCTQCTSGHYSEGGTSVCLQCPSDLPDDVMQSGVNLGFMCDVYSENGDGSTSKNECRMRCEEWPIDNGIGTLIWNWVDSGYREGDIEVTSCDAGYYVAANDSQACTQCTGAYYCPGDMSVKSCPAQTDGWTRGTGTGWDSYTDCYQTRQATDISDNCSAGQLKQIAYNETTWNAATVSVAFTAKAGAYISGTEGNTTCKLCEADTYQSQANSTATQCQTCATGYQANTTHDACVARQFQVTYDCGDGDGDAPGNETITYMEQFEPAANTCNAPSGKKFSHWYDGTNQWTVGDSYQWTYTYPLTLTAQYVAEDEKEITFNLGAENAKINGNDYTRYCNVDSGAFDLPTDVTRTAYKFAGWYDNDSLTGDAITSVAAGDCDDALSFWAKWEACDLSDGAGQCGCASDEYANGNGTCTSCVTSCSTLSNGEYKGEYNICANNGAGNAEEMCYTECTSKKMCVEDSSLCPTNSCVYKYTFVPTIRYYGSTGCVAAEACQVDYAICSRNQYYSPINDIENGTCVSCSTLPGNYIYSNAVVQQTSKIGEAACFKIVDLPCTPPVCPLEDRGTCDYDANHSVSGGGYLYYPGDGAPRPGSAKAYTCPSAIDVLLPADWACFTGYDKNISDYADASNPLPEELCVPHVYTITLNDYDGDKYIYQKYSTGWYSNSDASTALTVVTTPVRKGYTFNGYYTAATGGTRVIGTNGTLPAANTYTDDVTLYAQWTVNTYTITYNPNGGTNNAQNPGEYTIESATITLQNPTKTGYTFKNWTNADGDVVSQIASGSVGDVVLNANWDVNTYTITYNPNGGTNNAQNPTEYTIESATITLQNPTKRGYTFKNWTNADGDVVSQIASGSVGDVVLNANWDVNTYTITYNPNGGTNNAQNPSEYTIEDTPITLHTPNKLGYTFSGWSGDKVSGDITSGYEIPAGTVGNLTITANWTPVVYTIKFDANDGTTNATTLTCEYDDTTCVVEYDAEWTYHEFTGWKSEYNKDYIAGNVLTGLMTDMANAGVTETTLNATWNQIKKNCKTDVGAGKYYNGTEILPCPKGNYCPGNDENVNEGSQGCVYECVAGTYCPAESVKPTDCPEGSYCPAAADAPTDCPLGQYCPAKSEQPQTCPAGGATNVSRATNISQCRKVVSGSAADQEFGYGTATWDCGYTSGSGNSAKYQNTCIVKEVLTCDAGYYYQADLANNACSAVKDGYYSPAPTVTDGGADTNSLVAVPCPGESGDSDGIGSDAPRASITHCHTACALTTTDVSNSKTVTADNAKSFSTTNGTYPACSYTVTCNTGYTPVNGTNPKCQANEYVVTLNKNLDTDSLSDTIECTFDARDCALPTTDDLTRPGYASSNKWCTNADGTGTCYVAGVTPNTNISASGVNTTLYAIWEPAVFEISFDTTGATANATIAPVYLKYTVGWFSNRAATQSLDKLPAIPEKDNWVFLGFELDDVMITDEEGNLLTTQNALSVTTRDAQSAVVWTEGATECNAGYYYYYDADSGQDGECRPCEKGYWCPKGTYQTNLKTDGLETCPTYQSANGATVVGTTNGGTSATTAEACYSVDLDTYVSDTGNAAGTQTCYYNADTKRYDAQCSDFVVTSCVAGHWYKSGDDCDAVGVNYYSGAADMKRYACPDSGLTGSLTTADEIYDCFKTVDYQATHGSGTKVCDYTSKNDDGTANYATGCRDMKITACQTGHYRKNNTDTDCTEVGKGYYSGDNDINRQACPPDTETGLTGVTNTNTAGTAGECYIENNPFSTEHGSGRQRCDCNSATLKYDMCSGRVFEMCDAGYYWNKSDNTDCVPVGYGFFGPVKDAATGYMTANKACDKFDGRQGLTKTETSSDASACYMTEISCNVTNGSGIKTCDYNTDTEEYSANCTTCMLDTCDERYYLGGNKCTICPAGSICDVTTRTGYNGIANAEPKLCKSMFNGRYPNSDAGSVSVNQCFGECDKLANVSKMNGRDYYNLTDTCEIQQCATKYYLTNDTEQCLLCPANSVCDATSGADMNLDNIPDAIPQSCDALTDGTHTLAQAGSTKVEQCYAMCEDYAILGGMAIRDMDSVQYDNICTYHGVSETGNPCEIQSIKGNETCVERSCNFDYELIDGRCQKCSRYKAKTYRPNGNCLVETCESGYHPNGDQCAENIKSCTLPNAYAATQEWDDVRGVFGACIVTECDNGYHIEANACVPNIQVCDIEHGVGEREWNENRGVWGECFATSCDAGYTNDSYDSSEPNKQCGRCRNAISELGEPAVSTYIRGCQIGACMYQGELYNLENNECVSICPTDRPHEDETGRVFWNNTTKKCELECNDGYIPW